MADRLSELEYIELQEIFNIIDRNKTGSISSSDLQDTLDSLGMKITQEEFDKAMKRIDTDNITFDDFIELMAIKVNAKHSPDEIYHAFRYFETEEGSGYVHPEVLIKAISTYSSEKITIEQARELVSQLEITEDGLIDYQAFVDMILK